MQRGLGEDILTVIGVRLRRALPRIDLVGVVRLGLHRIALKALEYPLRTAVVILYYVIESHVPGLGALFALYASCARHGPHAVGRIKGGFSGIPRCIPPRVYRASLVKHIWVKCAGLHHAAHATFKLPVLGAITELHCITTVHVPQLLAVLAVYVACVRHVPCDARRIKDAF